MSIDVMTIIWYFFPPVLAYFVVAVLAVTPQTHALRIASWPVVTVLALRAVASLDMSVGNLDQRFNNMLFVFSMVVTVIHTLYWTIAKDPLVRHLRPAKECQSTIMDALDLALTLRGYGWGWSRGVHVQRETRPTDRKGFILHVFLSAVIHAFILGILNKVVRSFSPLGIGAAGGSIFDETLPFHARYLRATVISAFAMPSIYTFVQACYDACTIVGVVVFNQEPRQWPPAFDAPYRATSMADFWARRWHSFFRHMFLVLGGYPLGFLFGRVGYLAGTFLSSALMHHSLMVILNDKLEFWRLLVGFGMMAPVILAEIEFKRLMGRKVDGVAGWIWTMFWLFLGGNLIIDALARAGWFGCLNFIERAVPRQDVVERLVARIDSRLRAT